MRICFGLLVCTNDVVTSRCTICIATVGDGLIYGLLDGHFGIVGCSGVVVMMVYPNVLLHYNAKCNIKIVAYKCTVQFHGPGI